MGCWRPVEHRLGNEVPPAEVVEGSITRGAVQHHNWLGWRADHLVAGRVKAASGEVGLVCFDKTSCTHVISCLSKFESGSELTYCMAISSIEQILILPATTHTLKPHGAA